jgi:hypothetical protein
MGTCSRICEHYVVVLSEMLMRIVLGIRDFCENNCSVCDFAHNKKLLLKCKIFGCLNIPRKKFLKQEKLNAPNLMRFGA